MCERSNSSVPSVLVITLYVSHIQTVGGKRTSGQYLYKCTVPTTWQLPSSDKGLSHIPVVEKRLKSNSLLQQYLKLVPQNPGVIKGDQTLKTAKFPRLALMQCPVIYRDAARSMLNYAPYTNQPETSRCLHKVLGENREARILLSPESDALQTGRQYIRKVTRLLHLFSV